MPETDQRFSGKRPRARPPYEIAMKTEYRFQHTEMNVLIIWFEEITVVPASFFENEPFCVRRSDGFTLGPKFKQRRK